MAIPHVSVIRPTVAFNRHIKRWFISRTCGKTMSGFEYLWQTEEWKERACTSSDTIDKNEGYYLTEDEARRALNKFLAKELLAKRTHETIYPKPNQ